MVRVLCNYVSPIVERSSARGLDPLLERSALELLGPRLLLGLGRVYLPRVGVTVMRSQTRTSWWVVGGVRLLDHDFEDGALSTRLSRCVVRVALCVS